MPNLTDIKIPITGSQALTPSETPVQGVGATPVLPGSMPEPELSRGKNNLQFDLLIFLNMKIY